MANNSSIEWTEATWNPVAGCTVISPGCTNCYAMRMARRLELMGQPKYAGITRVSGGRAKWNGKIKLDLDALDLPKTMGCRAVQDIRKLDVGPIPQCRTARVYSGCFRNDGRSGSNTHFKF